MIATGIRHPSQAIFTGSRAILLVLAVAAGLRFVPIWFGLPYLQTRPDEVAAIGYASSILRGDLNPHFFHWPSLTFYLFAALFKLAAVTKALFGGGGQTLTATEMILIGRMAAALAGTVTVAVLFRVARRIGGPAVGLMAAAFLAVAILPVRESHFAMSDSLMTLLVTAALAALVRATAVATTAPEGKRVPLRGFVVAALLGGLAASTKYTAGAVVGAMLAAQIILLPQRGRWSARTWAPLAVFLVVCAAAFVAATPYAVLDWAAFSADLRYDATHLSGGHGIIQGRGWIVHLLRSVPYGTGIPIFLAAIAGIVPFGRLYPRPALLLGAFAVALYAAIGSGYTTFFRYALPLIPIVCVLAAVGVRAAGAWLASRTGTSTVVATTVLGLAAGMPALVNSVWFDVLLARTDSRVLAARWLAPRLDQGATIYDSGGQYTTLDLGTGHHAWRFDESASRFDGASGRTPEWLILQSSPVSLYASTPAALRRLAAEQYELVFDVPATRGPAASAAYDLQDAFFMPLSRLETVIRPGPTIRIYQRRAPSPLE